MSKSKTRRIYRKWHRRAGVVSALFVLFLSITGIFLNHTSGLGLGSLRVHSPALLAMYGQQQPALKSYTFNLAGQPHWVSVLGDSLFVGAEKHYQCSSPFVGVVVIPDGWALACASELVLFDHSSNILDVITPAFGLPSPVDAIGKCDERLCIQKRDTIIQLNIDTLTWLPTVQPFLSIKEQNVPSEMKQAILSDYSGVTLNWERVLLDLHAGRFMGSAGPWVMDVMALLFIVLAVSGIYLWWNGRKKKKLS